MQMTSTHLSSLSYWAGNSESKFMVEKIVENQSEVNPKPGDCSAFGWMMISAEGKKNEQGQAYWF